MIENGMYFALGFLISGLLALMFLPAFWRRALRLSTRRLEMRLPLSMNEIVAERDQLRAEFALGQRRLEQKIEDLAAARGRDMTELGRRSARIVDLEDRIAQGGVEHRRLEATHASALADLAAAHAEIGVAHQSIWSLDGRLGSLTLAHAGLADDHAALSEVAEQRRGLIASLETRIAGHEATIEGLREAWEAARGQSLEATLASHKLEEERDQALAEAASAAARRDQAQAQAREAQSRVQELDRLHREERRARMAFETDAATRASALALAEAREAALRESHAGALLTTRGGEQSLLARIEELKTHNAALQGALDAARREVAGHAGEAPAPQNDQPGDKAALRLAIRDIGSQVAKMVEKLEGDTGDGAAAPAAANDLADRVRALRGEGSRAAE